MKQWARFLASLWWGLLPTLVAFAGEAPLVTGGLQLSTERPLDIVGIRLGMPVEEAVRALKDRADKLRTEGVEMTIEPGELSYDVIPKPLFFGVRGVGQLSNGSQGEKIVIAITMPPNPQVVAEVHRWIRYETDPPTVESLVASLREKYGDESFKKESDAITHRWFFKDGKQQFSPNPTTSITDCTIGIGLGGISDSLRPDNVDTHLQIGFDRDLAPAARKACGAYVHAQINGMWNNKELVSEFRVDVVDVALEDAALERTRSWLLQNAKAKHDQAVESAKKVDKPVL